MAAGRIADHDHIIQVSAVRSSGFSDSGGTYAMKANAPPKDGVRLGGGYRLNPPTDST